MMEIVGSQNETKNHATRHDDRLIHITNNEKSSSSVCTCI